MQKLVDNHGLFWMLVALVPIVTIFGSLGALNLASAGLAVLPLMLGGVVMVLLIGWWGSVRWARRLRAQHRASHIVRVNELGGPQTVTCVLVFESDRMTLTSSKNQTTLPYAAIEAVTTRRSVFAVDTIVMNTTTFGALELCPLLADGVVPAGTRRNATVSGQIEAAMASARFAR